MLLTFLYMIITVMQARTILFLKTRLHTIFKQNKCSSIMLHTKSTVVLPKKDWKHEDCIPKTQGINDGYDYDDGFINFHLCVKNDTAKLGELLWYQGDMKLCTIYPEQKIDVSNWLAYPCGESSFPLYVNNCCQILNSPDKMHIVVEADLENYKLQASTIATKLEDYGLITSWTTKYESINFILETDIDHMTSFISAIMQGQNYINNGLFLTRIQSISVLGKPCIYDNEYCNESSPDENTMSTTRVEWDFYVQKLKALSNVARKMSYHEEGIIKMAELSNIVHSQNKNLNTTELKKLIEDKDKTDSINKLTSNMNIVSSKEVPVTDTRKESDLAIAQSSETIKKKDHKKENISSNTDNKTAIINIDQSKSTKETVKLKAVSTHSGSKEEEKYSKIVKPPNILIYADSPDAINNIKTVLGKVLDTERYVIYALSREAARSNAWLDQVALVVICGNIDSETRTQLVEYIIRGGKLLALCSDMLHTLLPSFKTAEVRESELVHFSYGKWKHVRMMHDIFCYHASPVRTRFSQDHEDTRTPALNPPASTSVKDNKGNLHSFDVKVLGKEETWHNPSILLATLASSGGKVVFSQIHLEIDPTHYEYEEDKFNALKESNTARLEIISDLLNTHLGMEINKAAAAVSIVYTPAYFLGTFEKKLKVIEKLKSRMQADNVLKMSNLDIRFCTSATTIPSASATSLPIMVHHCPANFSTVKYYECLTTTNLGRLVIYTDVLTSSMNVTEYQIEHGLAVITRQQTKGEGRSGNIWLSPIGCVMFTLQMHIPKDSFIGNHISSLQHYVAVAIVTAVRSKPGYQDINLRLKWPNDIYANNSTKIGGLLVHTRAEGSQYICNIGVGVNLSNSKPTLCINDLILEHNQKHGTKLRMLSMEEFVADIFNKLEFLCNITQNGTSEQFHNLYRTYWLHENSNITVIKPNGKSKNVKIVGIDDFGYMLVQEKDSSVFSVHPDGNSFDLLKGLIVPK